MGTLDGMKYRSIFALIYLLLYILPISTHAQNSLPISSVQGDGAISPIEGQRVTIEGVVTGLFDGGQADNPNWLVFVQDAGDGEAATSDGIPVYVGRERPNITLGDHVTVTGEVTEFFELTELIRADVQVLESGMALPDPVVIDGATDLETLEGMRVQVSGIGNQTGSCRFEVAFDGGDRALMPVLMHDDSICIELDANTEVATLIGVLTYHFGEYKIVLQNSADIVLEANEMPQLFTDSTVDCLLITEIYYRPIGRNTEEEWIELTNSCPDNLPVGSFKLSDTEGLFQFPNDAVIEAGRSIIVAQDGGGFARAFGFTPNFELNDSDSAVPNMRRIEGSGIALANDGDGLFLLDADDALIDAVSYGNDTTFLQPAPFSVGEGESLGRRFGNCDSDSAADFAPEQTPSPGVVVFDDRCGESIPNADDPLTIGAIQGNGGVSPLVNQAVTFEGVVTGWHEDRNTSGITFYTLYVQDMVGQEDGDPTTSDGIPVFLARQQPTAQIGDHVRVNGVVTEFFGLTEIDDEGVRVEILSSGNLLPTPIEIAPTNDADLATLFEPLEGMRVHLGFGAVRVVGATFDGCGFGVIREDAGIERVYRRSSADPIAAVIPILHRSDVDCSDFPNVKLNDVVSGLSGVLTYNFDQFKILTQSFDDVIVDEATLPEPPTAPTVAENQFSVISFNVENLFDRIDDTGNDAEPKLDERELGLKLAKLAYALGVTAGCPTVVAVQEVEKATLLEDLANGVAQYCETDYEVVHLESADVRGIDLAFLVDGGRVWVESAELHRTCTTIDTNIDDPLANCNNGLEPLFSRPPLLMKAQVDGVPFTFINNHFKSKRGGEFETEARRVEQAAFVATLIAANADERVVVIGDFNDYEDAEPMRTLERAGLENLLKRVPDDERYTFVFGGVAQLIDGVFVSEILRQEVTVVTILHTNADYPDSLGRDMEQMAFKATDHDLPFVLFDLNAEAVVEIVEQPVDDEAEGANWLLWGGIAGLVLLGGGVGFVAGRRGKPASEPAG